MTPWELSRVAQNSCRGHALKHAFDLRSPTWIDKISVTCHHDVGLISPDAMSAKRSANLKH